MKKHKFEELTRIQLNSEVQKDTFTVYEFIFGDDFAIVERTTPKTMTIRDRTS